MFVYIAIYTNKKSLFDITDKLMLDDARHFLRKNMSYECLV